MLSICKLLLKSFVCNNLKLNKVIGMLLSNPLYILPNSMGISLEIKIKSNVFQIAMLHNIPRKYT